MKNIIMGTAMVILCSIFLVFQNDINQMQRQQAFVGMVANEAAAALASCVKEAEEPQESGEEESEEENEEADETEEEPQELIFNASEGVKRSLSVVQSTMKLDASFIPQSKYFSESVKVVLLIFSQDETYCLYENGVCTIEDAHYEKGDCIFDYLPSPYSEKAKASLRESVASIDYPTTVCVLDAGKPRFSGFLGLSFEDSRICKVGIKKISVVEVDDTNPE